MFGKLIIVCGTLLLGSCTDKSDQLRSTVGAVSFLLIDPRPHSEFLLKNSDRLQGFHKDVYFGAGEGFGPPSTVVGRVAEIYCMWGDWDSAFEFSKKALSERGDTRAIATLLRATVESGRVLNDKYLLDDLRASDPSAAVDYVRLTSGAKAALEEGHTLLLKESNPLVRSAICFRLASASRTMPDADRLFDQIWQYEFSSADDEEIWSSALRKNGAYHPGISTMTCHIAWICLYALESDAVKAKPNLVAIWRSRYKKMLDSLLQAYNPDSFATVFLRSKSEGWK